MLLCSWVFSLPPPTLTAPLTPPNPSPPRALVVRQGWGPGGQPFVNNLVAVCRTPGSVHFQDNRRLTTLFLLQIGSGSLGECGLPSLTREERKQVCSGASSRMILGVLCAFQSGRGTPCPQSRFCHIQIPTSCCGFCPPSWGLCWLRAQWLLEPELVFP